MNKHIELLCNHSAWLFIGLLSIGAFGVAGWLPPIDPSLSADEVAKHFSENRSAIRVGISILALGSVFWWVFSTAIFIVMRRVNGGSQPLAYIQLVSATGTVTAILTACYVWLAAAYRVETSPEIIRVMNDLSWFCFVGMYPPIVLQAAALGVFVLSDRSAIPAYPRWIGYASFWAAFLFLPGVLLPFFDGGPFSWNGIISFWMVAIALFLWIIAVWWTSRSALKRHYANI